MASADSRVQSPSDTTTSTFIKVILHAEICQEKTLKERTLHNVSLTSLTIKKTTQIFLLRNDFPARKHHYCVQYHHISLNSRAREKRAGLLMTFDVLIWIITRYFTFINTSVGLLMRSQYAKTTVRNNFSWSWLNYTLKYTDTFNCIYNLQINFVPTLNCFSLMLVTSLRVTNERRIVCCLLFCTSQSAFSMSTRQIKFQVTGTNATKAGLFQFRICLLYMSGKFKYVTDSIMI